MILKKLKIPENDQVHIWSVFLPEAENIIDFLASILVEDEHQQAYSFKLRKHQKQYIITRGILKLLLSGYLDDNPKTIEIIYGLWGKPRLLKERLLHFNISHSQDYVLFAFTKDYEVGIDLEYIDKSLKIDEISLNFFSKSELNYWKNLDYEAQIPYFFKLWTCKEAYLKASGKGWLGVQKENFWEGLGILTNNQILFLSGEKMALPYNFECIPGYASALFIDGPPLHLVHLECGPVLRKLHFSHP